MLSGHAELVGTRGNFSYPNNGIPYQNYEIALFTISPSIPAQPTLRFTAMALESDSLCQYDSVRTFTWFNDQYSQVARWVKFVDTYYAFVKGMFYVNFCKFF